MTEARAAEAVRRVDGPASAVVTVAGVGLRALLNVLDVLPVAVCGGFVAFGGLVRPGAVPLVAVPATVFSLGWVVLLSWRYATRGSSPAAARLGVRVLRLVDDRPLGWRAWLLRSAFWYASCLVPVAWLALVILMLREPRRRGPHDLVAHAVVVHDVAAAVVPGLPAASAETFIDEPQPVDPVARPLVMDVPPVLEPPGLWDPWDGEPRAESPAYLEQLPYEAPAAYRPEQLPYEATAAYEPEQPPYEAAAAYEPEQSDPYCWWIHLDDGRRVLVRGLVLLGRSPEPRAGEEAEVVHVGVGGRLVSKTHLSVGVDAEGLYVVDRGSTNGTAVVAADGSYEPCPPGEPVHVSDGQIVSFGDRHLAVRRARS